MPRASIKSNLDCHQCGAHIITGGRLTCPRCNQSIEMASESDVLIDDQGRWKCQKCPEHGKNPKTLAIKEEIKCRISPCTAANNMLDKENSEMEDMDDIETQLKDLVSLAQITLCHISRKAKAVEGTKNAFQDSYRYNIDTSFLSNMWEIVLSKPDNFSRSLCFYNRTGGSQHFIITESKLDCEYLGRTLESDDKGELLYQLTEGMRKVVGEFDEDFRRFVQNDSTVAQKLIEEKVRA